MSAGVGTLVSTVLLLNTTLPSAAVTVLSSAAVGLVGGMQSRLTNHPPLINVLSGLQMLVPGGLGARGAARAMAGGDATGGLGFGASMLIVALEISVGLFMAKVCT